MAGPKDVVKQIRKATRRKFPADEKIRIVLEGLRAETPISEICRREGIAASVYYKWSKSFLEAGKNGLTKAAAKVDIQNRLSIPGVRCALFQKNQDVLAFFCPCLFPVSRNGTG